MSLAAERPTGARGPRLRVEETRLDGPDLTTDGLLAGVEFLAELSYLRTDPYESVRVVRQRGLNVFEQLGLRERAEVEERAGLVVVLGGLEGRGAAVEPRIDVQRTVRELVAAAVVLARLSEHPPEEAEGAGDPQLQLDGRVAMVLTAGPGRVWRAQPSDLISPLDEVVEPADGDRVKRHLGRPGRRAGH